jgi:tRNA modification GTPase
VTIESTTAALCTAPGRGGIAVITLVGPRVEEILASIFKPIGKRSVVPENALQLGRLVDDRSGATLDKVIVCRTRRGAEINIHGGPHIARRLLELLAVRGAEPHNCDVDPHGPLDAAHERWNNPTIGAELLLVLPRARSRLTAAALSGQWSGGLSELAGGDEPPRADKLREAGDGLKDMDKLLSPIEVVLAGPPNAGKSTLTNALVGREVSIVHKMAGTTRDWIREPAVINGVPIWLTDTAGLWDAPEGIDSEAVRRARHCAIEADIVILLDPDRSADGPEWLDRDADKPRILSVLTKRDEPADEPPDGRIEISAMTGRGIDQLKDAIVIAAGLGAFDPKTPRAFTTRQADILSRAADATDRGDQTAVRAALDELLRGPIASVSC